MEQRPRATYTAITLDGGNGGGKVVTVDKKTGILRSGSGMGKATIVASSTAPEGSSDAETLAILVEVLPVGYLKLNSHLRVKAKEGELKSLPVGYSTDLDVSFHDSLGRRFHATNNVLEYRPNRFDLTEIFADSTNRSLNVHLKQTGDTVLKVWDRNEPRLKDFIRIPVGKSLVPLVDHLTVGDIVCFSSPVEGSVEWRSSGSQVAVLDGGSGVGIVRGVGSAFITQTLDGSAKTATKLQVNSVWPDSVRFTEDFGIMPTYVTNVIGPEGQMREYIFPLVIGTQNQTSNLHGCGESIGEKGLSVVEENIPVRCSLAWKKLADSNPNQIFSISSGFSKKLGSYVCVVKVLPLDAADRWSTLDATLTITAGMKNNDKAVYQAEQTVDFYPALFLYQKEVQLNNLQNTQAVVAFSTAQSFLAAIKMWANRANFLRISGPEWDPSRPGRFQFVVELKTNSRALWKEYESESGLGDLYLTIRNEMNGQEIPIPLRVKLYGEAPKLAAFFGSGLGFWSFLDLVIEHYGSGIMVLVAILATLLAVFLGYRLVLAYSGSRSLGPPGIYSGATQQHSMNGHVTGPSAAYVQWRSHGAPPAANGVANGSASSSGGRRSFALWSTDRSQNPPWNPDRSIFSSDRSSWGSPQFTSSPVNRSN